MKIKSFLQEKQFILSILCVLALIAIFGSLEIIRGAALSVLTEIAMLILFLVIALMWIKKGRADWILYLYVIIQPLTRFPIYVFGSVRLSFVLLGLAVLGFGYSIVRNKSWHSLKVGKLIVPQLIFLFAIGLSTLINIAHLHSLERIILHISNFLFVLILLQFVNTAEKLVRLVSVWCASVTFMVVFGILASLVARFKGVTTSPFIQTSIDGIIRIQSLTPDSNYFAVLLFIPLCLGLGFLLSKKAKVEKKYIVFFWILVPLTISAMLITYSRAGLLALGLVLFCFIFFERQFLHYTFWVKFGTLIFASVLITVLIQPEFLRNMVLRTPDSVISQDQKIQYGTVLTFDKSSLIFKGKASSLYQATGQAGSLLDNSFQENIANDAIDVRGLYWGVALNMFQDSPIYGLGAGEYPHNFERYLGYSYFAKLPNTHDIFLETMAEFGVVGLIALLALLVRSLVLVWNLYRFSTGTEKVFLFGVGVAYVASLFQYCFQPSFNSMNFWLILGIVGCIEVLSRTERDRLKTLLISQ